MLFFLLPPRSWLGRFNDILKNKICVNIDEPDYNSFVTTFETFKNLITDDTIIIETKNKPQIEFTNCLWFIITTNNDKLFSISQTDRRFYFVNCGYIENGTEEKKKKFDRFYDMINNPDEIKIIYDYLENHYQECKDFNFEEHQKNKKNRFS